MKTYIVIIIIGLVCIASFSFISIHENNLVIDKKGTKNYHEPMSGFALEDVNQF